MHYGYFFEGEIVAPVPMCPRFNDIGAWHTLSDEERAEHGWHPCVVHDSRKDQRLHMRLPPLAEFKGDHFEATYSYVEKGLYLVMEEKLELLTSAYNAALVKPVLFLERLFTVNDIPALQEAVASRETTVYIESGLVVQMTANEAMKLTQDLLRHKQHCLRIRYGVQTQIKNATTPEEVVQVCVNSGFDQME